MGCKLMCCLLLINTFQITYREPLVTTCNPIVKDDLLENSSKKLLDVHLYLPSNIFQIEFCM